MVDIRNCRRCGKMFAYTRVPICPDCEKLDNEDLNKVRDYIKAHPGTKMSKVSEETEIPMNQIMKYLRDGRIELVDAEDLILTCEDCGKPITSGRKCAKCMAKLGKHLQTAVPVAPPKPAEESKKEGTTMHVRSFDE